MFCPGLASSSIYPPPQTPTSIWLLYVFIEWWTPNANTLTISLFFECGFKIYPRQVNQPSCAQTQCWTPAMNPKGATVQWFWGTTALSMEREQSHRIGRWRLLMLIVVCCVCVCGCVLCVGATLATIPVESQHRPRQNGPFLRSHITKSKLALKDPQYYWMCKLVIIQRCCTRFDFLGAKLCGPCYECTKNC